MCVCVCLFAPSGPALLPHFDPWEPSQDLNRNRTMDQTRTCTTHARWAPSCTCPPPPPHRARHCVKTFTMTYLGGGKHLTAPPIDACLPRALRHQQRYSLHALLYGAVTEMPTHTRNEEGLQRRVCLQGLTERYTTFISGLVSYVHVCVTSANPTTQILQAPPFTAPQALRHTTRANAVQSCKSSILHRVCGKGKRGRVRAWLGCGSPTRLRTDQLTHLPMITRSIEKGQPDCKKKKKDQMGDGDPLRN